VADSSTTTSSSTTSIESYGSSSLLIDNDETNMTKCLRTVPADRETKVDVNLGSSGVVWIKLIPSDNLMNVLFYFDAAPDFDAILPSSYMPYSLFEINLEEIQGECIGGSYETLGESVDVSQAGNLSIKLGVSKDWISDNDVIVDDLVFLSYDSGSWKQLDINYLYGLAEYEYFMVESDIYSLFTLGVYIDDDIVVLPIEDEIMPVIGNDNQENDSVGFFKNFMTFLLDIFSFKLFYIFS